MSRPPAGSVVIVDWRRGALPREPTKLRPAVVIEDDRLFPDDYPSTLVVPLTRDERLAHAAFAERIDPTDANGATSTSWALAHHVTSVSLQRINGTEGSVTPEQLASIRNRTILAIGADRR